MPEKMFIPLQSLISCFLKPRHEQASGSGYNWGSLAVCPKGSPLCWATATVAQAWGGSSVLNLPCAKDQVNENWAQVRYLADFTAGYEGDSLAHFFHCFFLLSFSSSVLGLEPSHDPWCLASGPNEAQALMSHCKNSARDTAIGKKWICSDSERSTLCRVWSIAEGSNGMWCG